MGEENKKVIGPNEVKKAEEELQRYKTWKSKVNDRLIENEKWWEFEQWDVIRKGEKSGDPEPKSGWLFNSIINKHADFMDNFPAPNILPREEADKETAELLSSVVTCILEQNNYEDRYSEACWDKIKSGPGVYAVLWDPYKDGIGDIVIKNIDILNMYWEQGVEDIQDSPNLFYQSLVDNDTLVSMYPQMQGKVGNGNAEIARYQRDEEEDVIDNKTVVTDWYYKKKVIETDKNDLKQQKTYLHFAKFCNGELLYATENDPARPDGIYDHGLYPFVLDVMFPVKGSPIGMGYIDAMKDSQMYIDKLQQSILKNAISGARPRYLSRDNGGINEAEYTDLNKDIVHYNGQIEAIQPIEHKPLDSIYLNVMTMKVDELKETSGNRDFSQGATTSGVTAASAIAALQEAGSKLSRDMIKTSYRACSDTTYMIIELMRQYYDVPRVFRIVGDQGMTKFVKFDNSGLKPEKLTKDFDVLTGGRKPYFDIKISAQKASPFTKISQNELAKELYNLGFFNPQFADQALMCIDMMYFDGKEEIQRKISENGTMYQQLQAMQQQMSQMAALIAKMTGDTRLVDATSQMGVPTQGIPSGKIEEKNVDDFGNIAKEGMNSTAGKARAKAAAAATPKV